MATDKVDSESDAIRQYIKYTVKVLTAAKSTPQVLVILLDNAHRLHDQRQRCMDGYRATFHQFLLWEESSDVKCKKEIAEATTR